MACLCEPCETLHLLGNSSTDPRGQSKTCFPKVSLFLNLTLTRRQSRFDLCTAKMTSTGRSWSKRLHRGWMNRTQCSWGIMSRKQPMRSETKNWDYSWKSQGKTEIYSNVNWFTRYTRNSQSYWDVFCTLAPANIEHWLVSVTLQLAIYMSSLLEMQKSMRDFQIIQKDLRDIRVVH